MYTILTSSLNWKKRKGAKKYGTPSKTYTNSVPDKYVSSLSAEEKFMAMLPDQLPEL